MTALAKPSRRRAGAGTFDGEVAIVTGASSGIGAATASALAARGARVVLAARRADLLRAEQQRISASGGTAIAVETDVGDPGQLARLVASATDEFGRVDILVNNSGAFWRTSFAASAPEDVRRVIEVNLVSATVLTRLVLPGMLERRHGSIISVASLSGRVAMEPVYSASKYGLRGFSLALRRQLAGSGVNVSLVSPGNIRTDMTSHIDGNLPAPSLVADTVCALVTRPRREVIVPGRHYAIAWLEQFLPSLADVAHRTRHWSPVH
jgi:NAD(P)-dependent dehydrogenase (short-subunit alcohol dehydrogenase family)